MQRVRSKFGVTNRSQLIGVWLQEGIVSPTERKVQARRNSYHYAPQISAVERVIYGKSYVLRREKCRAARGKKRTLCVDILRI